MFMMNKQESKQESKQENKTYQPLRIKAGDYPITVFRVDASPRLSVNKRPKNQEKSLAWLHTHFTYEVFFSVSGEIKLVTEQEIGEYQNSILIIPPQIPHVSIREGECYCLLFAFDSESTIAGWLERGVYRLPMSEDIAFYIRKLTEKTLEQTEDSEYIVHHLAALIFTEILSAVRPEMQESHSKRNHSLWHIGVIEEFINKNLGRKLVLSDVAEAVHLSSKQITRIIEKEYGCSFPELLNDKRMSRAVALLRNTDMKISEIIAQTFCNAPTYFYRVFKDKYGMSPLKYRKEIRIAEKTRLLHQ